MKKNNSKVIIIGSVPAGLSAGYELLKNGIQVEFFEASNVVGVNEI